MFELTQKNFLFILVGLQVGMPRRQVMRQWSVFAIKML
jgi:hypothetical protein